MDHQLELLALVAADRRRTFLEAAESGRLIHDSGLRRRGLVSRFFAALKRSDPAPDGPDAPEAVPLVRREPIERRAA